MRITSKGQVTIPKHLRRRRNMRPGSNVEFVERGDDLVVRQGTGRRKGQPPKDEFAQYLDRVSGIVDIGMRTDEFMQLLRGE